jgi:hypothetical protein
MIIDSDRSDTQDAILAVYGGLARFELGSTVLYTLLANKEQFLLEVGKVVDVVHADMLERNITQSL